MMRLVWMVPFVVIGIPFAVAMWALFGFSCLARSLGSAKFAGFFYSMAKPFHLVVLFFFTRIVEEKFDVKLTQNGVVYLSDSISSSRPWEDVDVAVEGFDPPVYILKIRLKNGAEYRVKMDSYTTEILKENNIKIVKSEKTVSGKT